MSGSLSGAGGVGGLIFASTQTPDPGTHASAFDGNGNVIGYVDMATGAKSATYEYNAFGETIISDGPAAALFPFGFSTKYRDSETGHYYYGYRCYAPETGRWLSRDPMGENGGVNLYGMVGNDPINDFDPLGREGFWKWMKETHEDHMLRLRGTLDNAVFFYDWVFEKGPEKRTYKDGDRLTELLKKSNGIKEALAKYKARNCPPVLDGNYETIQGYKDTFFHGGALNPAEWQIGGYIWKIAAASNGTVKVHVDNDASLRSFAGQPFFAQKYNQGASRLGLPAWDSWPIHTRPQLGQPNRSTDVRFGGNIEQKFDFTMPSPCCSEQK